MKALCVLDTLEVGGAEVSLREIFRRFCDVEVVVYHLYPGDRLADSYRQAGIRVESLGLEGKYSFAAGVRRLLAAVEEERPDLLISALYRAGIVARRTAACCGIPLVDSLVNDSYSPERWRALSLTNQAKLAAVALLDRWTAPHVTAFTAVSRSIRDSHCLILGIEPERVEVIYRGRDPARFRPRSPAVRREIRHRLGYADHDLLLLNVARLLPRKGQGELLEAFARIVSREPKARLLLAGEGESRSALEDRLAALRLNGRARLLGTRSDVPELLAAADFFLFPSHYEGHGGALVEAMFAGLPIIASDTAIHRESLCSGDTGILVPLHRPELLAAAVLQWARRPDQARQLGERARREALERFHIDHVARCHERFYRAVAQGEAPGQGGL